MGRTVDRTTDFIHSIYTIQIFGDLCMTAVHSVQPTPPNTNKVRNPGGEYWQLHLTASELWALPGKDSSLAASTCQLSKHSPAPILGKRPIQHWLPARFTQLFFVVSIAKPQATQHPNPCINSHPKPTLNQAS